MPTIEKTIISAIKKALPQNFPDCDIYLEVPKQKEFGDFSTNIAMRLSKIMKNPPMDIADLIVKDLKLGDVVDTIKVEKLGFINFYLSNKAVITSLKEMLSQGDKFGYTDLGKGKKVQIEFVSANPTGPLTVAHGRQAAVGDSLARILKFCGYKVTKEYYINDEGVQMGLLGKSVKARFMEIIEKKAEFPENGYKGQYIYEIAKEISHKFSRTTHNAQRTTDFFTDYAYKAIMQGIKKDLKDFGVDFDVWYSQKELTISGKIQNSLMILKDKGFLYEKDGATWFKSSGFGDDKDRVIIKNDGSFTYLTSDVAYHRDKFERGYEWLINIWGPDHHGYVNRVKAACEALGYSKDAVSILISQLVTLYRNKKPVRMSTREGEFVTLREIIDEVGKDAARFFFIMRRTDSHLDFDLEIAKSKTLDNPVYYIQYGHARIASVLKFAGKLKMDLTHLDLLDKPEEIGLIKALMQYPKIIHSSAHNLEPYTLLTYLQDLAKAFHSYYGAYRIVTDDKKVTIARILLVKELKTVLFSGLTLLGVTAPEKM